MRSLSTSFEANYAGGTPVQAHSDDTLTIAWADSSPGWNGFDLENPWTYDGTGNLIVEFRYMGSSGTTVNTRAAAISPADRCLDGPYPTSPSGSLMSFLTGLRIHFVPTGIHEPSPGTGTPLLRVESPVSDPIGVVLSASPGREAVLRAFSIDGRSLGVLWRGVPDAGATSLSLPSSGLPAGLILLVLDSDGMRSVARTVRLP